MHSPAVIPPHHGHQRVTAALLFAAYLAGFGVFIPFFPVWLDGQGLDARWIAVLVAAPLLVRVLTTSLVADAAERFDDPRLPLRALALVALLLFALLPLLGLLGPDTRLAGSPWVILLIVALMAVAWNALLPLCDALGIEVARTTGTAYGAMRVWGSIAFVLASVGAGMVVERAGTASIPWMITLAFAAMLAVCLALPSSLAARGQEAAGASVKLRSGWVFFLRRKGAMSVFIGAWLMQASHAVLYGFGSLSWSAQGFSESTIGFLWSLGVVSEIILFALSGPIIARIGARGLLLLGGVGATIRWVAFAFTPDLAITIPLQVLHGFSFAMSHLALIAYIARRARPRELRAAQGVYGVVSGALMAGATLAAGPLYASFGAGAYMVMGVMTALGFAIILVNRVRVPGGASPKVSRVAG